MSYSLYKLNLSLLFLFKLVSRYLAIEQCAGSLDDLVRGRYRGPIVGPIPEVLRQVLKGVNHLHTLEIFHGDLKPCNILISIPKGDLLPVMKVADFGLFHADSDDEERQSSPASTLGWSCPTDPVDEVGKRSLSSDIFPLGNVFGFTASNGVHPFGSVGSDLEEAIKRIKKKRPIVLLLKQLDKSVRSDLLLQLIVNMVNYDAKKRPTTAEILDHDFFNRPPVFAVQQGQLVNVSPPRNPQPAPIAETLDESDR